MQFESIVELALARADRDDANKLALIGYRKHITPTSSSESINQATRRRKEAYACITELLELLYVMAISKKGQPVMSTTLNSATFLYQSTDAVKKLTPSSAFAEIERVVGRVFHSDDELAHVAIFEWLLSHGMDDTIIKVRKLAFVKID